MRNRILLLVGLVLMIFGTQIILRGIEVILNPIPGMELAPYLLAFSGTLFLIVGFNFPRLFRK